jgi:hypothetical protein
MGAAENRGLSSIVRRFLLLFLLIFAFFALPGPKVVAGSCGSGVPPELHHFLEHGL